ncbi:MAG: phenylalanine--tRNA ligase subunit beta [Prevotellaceae bacterium]|jgi:phenylalanyl-tRNA synthetase beta chain|nr:phenylalanine--tRNA ligase subunit beta [Prevotellaceae bacterium]
MKISYNWLKNYLSLEETPEQTAKILTSIGLEVESAERIEAVRGGLHGVLVGKVLSCGRHPDADRLSVTSVDVGAAEPLQIVCGAPNVAAGQMVAVATVGTKLFSASGEELRIKKSKIRGIESSGMICAEDELGLGTSHEGIMVLSEDCTAGSALRDLLKIEDDTVFEIGLTPNRIDAASHYGVARDLAAYLRRKASLPDVSDFKIDNRAYPVKVEVQSMVDCPRYSGLTISGVKIKPSPEWLQRALRAIGINPKNNAVDITNFVLHELGQPLHAFDADKIEDRLVVVRRATSGEKFKTLDGEVRILDIDDLMICDSVREMCIAGVFGGADSGVSDETRNIFLESAHFNPVNIRKTARRHGLFTDSSFRFERGTDPNMTITALKRAALLFKELCEGEISSDIVDMYPFIARPCKVRMSYSRLCRLAGKAIPRAEIRSIIEALEMEILEESSDEFLVIVPLYRVDVRRECDIIEDVLRIYGYNNIEPPRQVRSTLSHAVKPDKDKTINVASDFLSSNGFNEIMCNSLTSSDYYAGLNTYPPESLVQILNPLSSDLNSMRQTLLFGGLEVVAHNLNRRNQDLKLYETGNCYRRLAAPESSDVLDKYGEDLRLALFLTGNERTASWNQQSEPTSFFTLKSWLERLLARFGIDAATLTFDSAPCDIFSEGLNMKNRAGHLLVEMGIVSKSLCRQFDIRQDVYFAELRYSALFEFIRTHRIEYSEMSRFPEVRRDLALVINKDVTFATLRDLAFRTERKLLKRVGLFDVYEGDKLPAGKKQYALSFVLQDRERTLTDTDIDGIMSKMLKVFDKEVGARLR